MDILIAVLHGLAYFGVWVLNVVIYEAIAVLVWLACSGIIWGLHTPAEEGGKILAKIAVVLCILFLIAAAVCCFGWIRIVPFPVFE